MLIPAWTAACEGFSGRRFLLAWPVAQVARRWVARLQQMGLPPPFVLGLYDGISTPLPLPADHLHVIHPGPPPALAEDENLFEIWQGVMKDLPAEAMRAIHAWDPHGEAVVIVPPAAQLEQVAGRRVFGGTPHERTWIEDKTRVDALFETLAIPTAPHRVVSLAEAAQAAAELDRGAGTVWAGDNTTHIEAGARALVHVHDSHSHDQAMAVFSGRCRTVRIQPFLAGVPCSIQGICTPDGVALTRPTEMLVLRDPREGSFLLVGMATVWDPPDSVHQALRHAAGAVGEHLRTVYNWRGGFSVDGIATPDGAFWPTEVNARMSAGLAVVDGCLPGPSLEVLERLLREGLSIGVSATQLEDWMARPLRARRTTLVRVPRLPPPDMAREVELSHTDLTDEDAVLGRLHYDREGAQGVLRLELDPTMVPRGVRIGPLVEEALQLAAQLWSLPVARWRST